MAGYGVPEADIAAVIGIDPKTIGKGTAGRQSFADFSGLDAGHAEVSFEGERFKIVIDDIFARPARSFCPCQRLARGPCLPVAT